jgi:hypothetical protein
MNNEKRIKKNTSERGAALVMVLLIAMLMLVASAGLLLEVSMNSANVTDATAEQQAYNAAESGVQSAINVLRGNTVPNPLIDPTRPATDPINRISFRKAINLTTSNSAGETGTTARLSRWMGYNYPNGSSANRITLNPGYQPMTGFAFSVQIEDPDNTGSIISFNTTGRIYDPRDSTWKSAITYGTAPNTATITYTPYSINNLDVSSGSANTNFGSFRITVTGTGATIPVNLRFEIVMNLVAPYTVSRSIRGNITSGTILPAAIGTVRYDFDSQFSEVMGAAISLTNDPWMPVVPNIGGGVTTVTGSITPAEPYRVVVTSTGYGPRGAVKVLEATVQKNFFNGMTAPATLTLIGPAAGMDFDPGQSAVTEYSGDDVASNVIIPPIGTTNDANLQTVFTMISGSTSPPFNGTVTGTPANVSQEMPWWLQTTTNLNSTIQSLRMTAISSGRYFANGATPSTIGDNATARGITFVNGDLTLTGSGGGLLIVTGKLTLHGNFNFNGMIIVTGSEGVDRRGGGNGTLQGNIVVAAYNPSNLNAGFLPPRYNLSGGGNSGVVYNSSSVANGMVAVSNFVLGVAEK